MKYEKIKTELFDTMMSKEMLIKYFMKDIKFIKEFLDIAFKDKDYMSKFELLIDLKKLEKEFINSFKNK